MSCGNCPNLEECKEFALNLNPDSDYKKLHPDLIREVEQCMEKCKIDCAEWKSGGEEYYRDKLNEEIGKSLHAMRDIRTHIESVCKYQSEYLSSNIKWYCIYNERRKMFVSELERLNGEPQPEPFVMDIRLQSDRARAMFELFPKYVEVREGMKLKWLQGTKADFLCFVEEALEYLHYDEEKDKWSLFEKSFEIYDDRFKPTQLLSYSKKPNVKKHIEENEGLCGKIKMTFTMNFK